MEDKYIWFIRHAQSEQNASIETHSCNHVEDIGLSEKGLSQAKELAERSTLIPELIFMSPYKRCIFTAAPYIDKLITSGHIPEMGILEELHEFHYYNEMIQDSLNRIGGMINHYEIIKQYWRDLNIHRYEGFGTETYLDFLNRVIRALNIILNAKKDHTLVFTHYYVITCIENLIKASIDINKLEEAQYLNIGFLTARGINDRAFAKEMMSKNAFVNETAIPNCNALYLHIKVDTCSYEFNSFKVVGFGRVDRIDKNGLMGENIVVE